jgi:hypothetical protein
MKTVHAEIEYQKEDGTWVHSDICPPNCDSDNLNYVFKREDGDFTYSEYLHRCLDEWLNNSNGTGAFYIKNEDFIIFQGEES